MDEQFSEGDDGVVEREEETECSKEKSFGFFASGERFATRMKKILGGGETASKTTTAKLELDDEGELLSRCNGDGGLKRRKLVDSDDSGGLTPWRKLCRGLELNRDRESRGDAAAWNGEHSYDQRT